MNELMTMEAARFDVEAPCGKKALRVRARKDGTLDVSAYATVWGELDCDGERMTKGAIEPYVGKGMPLMLWLHGTDKAFGSKPVGQWKSLELDDLGLQITGTVTDPKAIKRLRTARSFGLSVGSVWYLTRTARAGDGQKDIIDWPLLEVSIMEGGAQCVPSAMQELKAGDLMDLLAPVATKMGVELRRDGQPGVIRVSDAQIQARAVLDMLEDTGG